MNGALEGHGDRDGLAVDDEVDVLGELDGVEDGVFGGSDGEAAVEAALTCVVDGGAGDGEGGGGGDLKVAVFVVGLGQLDLGGVGLAVIGVGSGECDVDVEVDGGVSVLYQLPLGLGGTDYGAAGVLVAVLTFATEDAAQAVSVLVAAAGVLCVVHSDEAPLGSHGDLSLGKGVAVGSVGNVTELPGGVGGHCCGAHDADQNDQAHEECEGTLAVFLDGVDDCHGFNLPF